MAMRCACITLNLNAVVFKKVNSNINIYNNNNNKMRQCNFWESRMLHYLSVLQKTPKTMECTPKRVIKVTVTKNEIYKPKIQHEKTTIQLSSCSKCCPLSRTRVLSLRHHWSKALSWTLCLSSALTEMRRSAENHIYSVLLAYWNDYQIYGLKCLLRSNLATVTVNK